MKRLILFFALLAPFLGFGQIHVTDSGDDFRIVRGTSYDNYFQKGQYEMAFSNEKIWIRNIANQQAILSSRIFSEYVVDGSSYGTRDSTLAALAEVIYSSAVALSGDTLIVGSDTVLLASGASEWESGSFGGITPKLDRPIEFDSTGATSTTVMYQADSMFQIFTNGLTVYDTITVDSMQRFFFFGTENAKETGWMDGIGLLDPTTFTIYSVGVENINGTGDFVPRIDITDFPNQLKYSVRAESTGFSMLGLDGFEPNVNKQVQVTGSVDDLVLSATNFETASVTNLNVNGISHTVTDTLNMDTMKVEILPIGSVITSTDATGYYTQISSTPDFVRIQQNDTIGTDPESDILMNAGQIEIVNASADHTTEGNMILDEALVSSGTLGTSDFVFGSAQLDDAGNVVEDKRLIFDKSQSFFGAGQATSTQWDVANRGAYSAVFGNNNKASGDYSMVGGQLSNATGGTSFAWGRSCNASANYAHSLGYENDALGQYSMVLGGIFTTASGTYAVATGNVNTAPSYAEFVMGRYATNYTPSSATTWNDADRIFNIGNGTGVGDRHDLFTILKDGAVGIGNIDNFETASTGEMLQVNGAIKTDTLKVMYPKTGWAQYTDTLYTIASPLTVNAGDTVTLHNRAHTKIETYLPSTVTALWDTTSGIIGDLGASYNVRVNFSAENNNVSGSFDIVFDIGADENNPVIILERVATFPKGANTQTTFSSTTALYALSTFVSNGCRIRILGNTGTTLINNISVMIIKTTHAE